MDVDDDGLGDTMKNTGDCMYERAMERLNDPVDVHLLWKLDNNLNDRSGNEDRRERNNSSYSQ